MTTTTGPATRRRAFNILRDLNASEEQAEAVLRRFADAGIHLVEVEAPEPYTGERAGDTTKQQAIAQARAAIRGAHYTEGEA